MWCPELITGKWINAQVIWNVQGGHEGNRAGKCVCVCGGVELDWWLRVVGRNWRAGQDLVGVIGRTIGDTNLTLENLNVSMHKAIIIWNL
jgi:hypothetical protein